MKKAVFILVSILICCGTLSAGEPGIDKETFVYSIKDKDTLRLDKYEVLQQDVPCLKGKPCMIFMFGGGFFTGARDKQYYIQYFEHLAEQGFAVVSIDYRLGFKDFKPEKGMKSKDFIGVFENVIMMAVEDLFDATNFIIKNAGEWNIDTDKIVISGSSAGAISVLQAEYERCNLTRAAWVLPRDFKYAGVVAFAGAIYSNSGNLKWKDVPAPVMLFHGDVDSNVPYNKIKIFKHGFFGSKNIAKRYDKYDFPYYLYVEENADHRMAGDPMRHNLEEIDAFLRKYVLEEQRLVTRTTVTQIDKPKVKKPSGIKSYVRTNFVP